MSNAAPDARQVMLSAAFIYGDDVITITIPPTAPEQEACLARGETGVWVKAWVYVPYDTLQGS